MLVPFSAKYFPVLKQWVNSKELLFRFSATTFSYPLKQEYIIQYLSEHSDRKMYMSYLEESNEVYAFGEIIPQDSQSVRLARLLVGKPDQRGKGLGGKFVHELLAEAIQTFKAKRVDLFVFPDNAAAIRCYQKIGFTFHDEENQTLDFEGKTFLIRKMRLWMPQIPS